MRLLMTPGRTSLERLPGSDIIPLSGNERRKYRKIAGRAGTSVKVMVRVRPLCRLRVLLDAQLKSLHAAAAQT